MESDFNDVDVISELEFLSSENNYTEITNLLRENLYQFNKEPTKLIAILTIRLYYNLLLKNYNDVDSDFELIESIFKNKLNCKFPYTRRSRCPFSTFLIYAYYPHLKGLSFLSLERLYNLLSHLQEELNDKLELSKQTSSPDSGFDSEPADDSRTNTRDFSEKTEEVTDRSQDSTPITNKYMDDQKKNIYKKYEKSINKIIMTVLLTSDVLLSLLRPMEAIRLLKDINLKYDPENTHTNLILSLIYRKLGYVEESKRHMNMISDSKNENYYKGILKIFEKDYEGAVEDFKSTKILETMKRSRKHVKAHEIVFVNNLSMATLYAQKSQEAKKLFFQYNFNREGLQAHRGISSNADVLKELSIYN